jgi:hypothetical protein
MPVHAHYIMRRSHSDYASRTATAGKIEAGKPPAGLQNGFPARAALELRTGDLRFKPFVNDVGLKKLAFQKFDLPRFKIVFPTNAEFLAQLHNG